MNDPLVQIASIFTLQTTYLTIVAKLFHMAFFHVSGIWLKKVNCIKRWLKSQGLEKIVFIQKKSRKLALIRNCMMNALQTDLAKTIFCLIDTFWSYSAFIFWLQTREIIRIKQKMLSSYSIFLNVYFAKWSHIIFEVDGCVKI